MKKTVFLLLVAAGVICRANPIYADFDLSRSNNKFGIHLAQPHLEEIKRAAELVNSNGGDWGYVTLVIQENDRDRQKWQEIFDLLRQYHLIPIIRLATQPEGEIWRRPSKEDVRAWVEFLDSLNWVVKNRYVILFNEPNHGQEWGGEVDAKDYAEVAFNFAKSLKEKNPSFFIMLAGFDTSAPSSVPNYEDEGVFLREMFNVTSYKLQDLIDGWSSHSYPNPAFSGSIWDTGRRSIRGYLWELDYLKSLGVTKNLPVFITETGWDGNRVNRDSVADNYQAAFQSIWQPDDRVVAVTPFVLDYQGPPFLGFSWKLPADQIVGDRSFYQQYYTIASLAKIKGNPEIIEKGVLSFSLPHQLVTDSTFNFPVKIKNLGEGIWDRESDYYLSLNGYSQSLYSFSDLKDIKPDEEAEINLYLKTSGLIKQQKVQLVLFHGDKKIVKSDQWQFNILGLPKLDFKVNLYPKLKTDASDLELQLFDKDEKLIFKRKGLKVNNGLGKIDKIQNIILGDRYRAVIIESYYLPRQTFITFKKDDNSISFRPMIPLDFDLNGRFSFNDLIMLIRQPKLFKLLFP